MKYLQGRFEQDLVLEIAFPQGLRHRCFWCFYVRAEARALQDCGLVRDSVAHARFDCCVLLVPASGGRSLMERNIE